MPDTVLDRERLLREEIARELGLETYPQHVQGDNLIIVDGKVGRHTGTIPRVNPLA